MSIIFVELIKGASSEQAELHAGICNRIAGLEDDKATLAASLQGLKAQEAGGFSVKSAQDVQQSQFDLLQTEIAIRLEAVAYCEGVHRKAAITAFEAAVKKPDDVKASLLKGLAKLGYTVGDDGQLCVPPVFWIVHPGYRSAVQDADAANDVVRQVGVVVHNLREGILDAQTRLDNFRRKTLTLA